MSEKKLFLLDGHALVYRAHYAFINRPLINSKGINTSAITGFVRTLWDILKNQEPSHIAVAFDPKGKTFRHTMYEPYKATRQAQPEDISIALPYIHSIVEGFNIPIPMVDNYEADDIIGALAKQAEAEGFTVYMVTPDKDYAQLVSDKVFMYKPSRSGNGVEILGVPEVLEKWDIEKVEQVIDVLGLQGDAVDNIPGIPGIGAKTASKLLHLFGSVEGIIANTDKLKGKQKENIENFAEQGMLSKELATINLQSPIKFDAKKYLLEPVNKEKLTEIFQELEFRSLAKTILGDDAVMPGEQASLFASPSNSPAKSKSSTAISKSDYAVVKDNITNVDHDYVFVDTPDKRKKLIKDLSKQKSISFDTETTSIDSQQAELVGISFSWKAKQGYYVPIPEKKADAIKVLAEFKPILENENIEKIGQNIKYDINIVRRYDCDVKGEFFDTMIAHYLLQPDQRHKLDYLSEAYLGYKMVPITDIIGKPGVKQLNMRDIAPEKVSDYAAEDADITYQVRNIFEEQMKERKLTKLYDEIEMPLIRVLSEMEYEGVNLNKKFLEDYSKVLTKLIIKKEKDIYKKAGVEFNIASPKQVGQVLFEKLEIPYRWRKTASGQHSTSEEKLTELSKDNKIVADILLFRRYAKLRSTYVDALPLMINPETKRVHSSFNQARAATGRLSSEAPNLQNIPIKNDEGREIRKAFIPRDKDHILLAADYSQVELRLIAEISKDKNMLDAFQKGQDIHSATAAGVYNVPIEEVTPEQRRNAKTVNFSITYGAGATNLSRQLNIKRGEAKELIENYFKQYNGLQNYMTEIIEFAKENGYVETLLGRKRELRDINSKNGLIRSNAERMAINTPIQGTAADMIKIAMINISKEFKKQKFKSKMILQVHDELVFDVHRKELKIVEPIIVDLMKNAIPDLKVPILVEAGTGENWLEAH